MRERLRFCPRTPEPEGGRAFGVNRKTPCLLRPAFAHWARQNSDWRRSALDAPSSARPAPKTDPLPETVSRPVARCIARARDGDGGGVQECRRPNVRNFAPAGARPKGRAGPSATILAGPLLLVGPALAGTPPMIGISVAGMPNVDDRRAGGGDDHDRHQGAFPEDMVC